MTGRWLSLSQLNRGPIQAVTRCFCSVVRWTITSSMGVYVAAHWLAFGSEVKLSADYALEKTVGAIGSSIAPSIWCQPVLGVVERVELALPNHNNNSCSPRGAAAEASCPAV